MLISREVDYGIRIMIILCNSNVEKKDAKEIAQTSGVSLRFTLKILGKLTSATLVKSFRGAKGGYVINKDPKEINIYDIICALEGGVKINACFEDSEACNLEKCGAACNIHSNLNTIRINLIKDLKEVTLDTLLK
ncbi:transcriptional regulator, BadM/Rrf2 family [Cetobacterium ceti]|uniref:Transcriptional regulator, BadM/Rrf2 family n=1 Tax=Cetobacterium ceti TaxID=180163 RepID=A0A1T4QPU1_9FUSO|nr:Rrf2 family transcriptional regulator [Cetobacterium ceti]SKA05706.1 transcriptional regulator, BadM/Rrf2 family [Cetobacterium ceti]